MMMTTDRESWRKAATAAGVFIAWTVTSFVCHESGKLFLMLSEKNLQPLDKDTDSSNLSFQRFCLAVILTTTQCVTCLLLMSPAADIRNITQSPVTWLLLASHALATLATNYSMAFIEAASTLAIKLTEPITMAIAHHVVSQTMVPIQTVISIPIIVFGALVFTGPNVHHNSRNVTGILLAFASNVILAARNLTFKKLQDAPMANAAINMKSLSHIALVLLAEFGIVGGVFYLQKIHMVTNVDWILLGLCLISGIFHVTYSYISANVVLKVMNVVSHSVANIFKRFLVVLLLCVAENRQITAVNFFGLCISFLGLLIYTHSRKVPDDPDKGQHIETDPARSETGRRKVYVFVGLAALTAITVIGSTGRIAVMTVSEPATDSIPSNANRENYGWEDRQMFSTDFSHLVKAETDPTMREFLTWHLVDHPEDTDKRARMLTSSKEVIEEAQRVLVNLLQDLLGKAKHVMLIEIATYENKGDPAISVGEIMLLRRLNVSVVFYCGTNTCKQEATLKEAHNINKLYAKDELVLLLQGGGNLVGYSHIDRVREIYVTAFPDRRIILFSQSIWLKSKNDTKLEYPRTVYSNRSNLVMLLRDRQSLEIARENFKGVKLILAPDLAFCIGMVPRQLPPIYDIVWLKRNDGESSKYILPSFPPNISVDVYDWHNWNSNKGQTDMETSFLITSEGFQFLQRGRIVVTDRLHGHILSTLMNIPHVLIDNPPYLKLSTFDRSWTSSLRNTKLVSNGSLALDAAMELLRTYHNYLPSVAPKDMYVGFNGDVLKKQNISGV